jgi:hypothetical protein
MDQLEDLVQAVDLDLEPGEIQAIEELYEPHKVLVGRQR